MRDLTYAVRRLRGSPLFTAAAAVTLSITIGATTAVFGVVNGVLLKGFPYADPSRVVVVWETNPDLHLAQFHITPADYVDLRAQTSVFSATAASALPLAPSPFDPEYTVTGSHEPERVRGLRVTPNYFQTLGITPSVGRTIAEDSSGPAEVVISRGYWERRFGSEPSALGRTLTLNDRPYTVVGVMPGGIPGDIDLWTRLSFTGAQETNRGSYFLTVYGRLKPGTTLLGARSNVETISNRLAQTYPISNKGWSMLIHPLLDDLVGDVRPALLMLLAAAACVLLIGAANLANLFLVRCLARERELAVRTALGATPSRLVHELALEAMVLGVAAGIVGVGVAVLGVNLLGALAPSTLPRLNQVGVDLRVLAFCALTSIGTVMIFGVLPAWLTSRESLSGALKEGGRGTGSTQHHRLQDVLVVLQVVIAVVLLTGAGLLAESFEHSRHLDTGLRPTGVLTAQIALSKERYGTAQEQAAFISRVVEQLEAEPEGQTAAAADALPGPHSRAPVYSFVVVGDPSPDPTDEPFALTVGVTPDYFATMGIRLLAGRGVLPTDDERAARVCVVDALLVRQVFAGRAPLGRQLAFGKDTLVIVGVAAHVKEFGVNGPDQPLVYSPLAQHPGRTLNLAVRTSHDRIQQTAALERVVSGIDRTVPVSDVRTMSDRMAESLVTTRFATALASLFAVIALVLGVVGIYSVLAYIVGQRQREIAVRLALGARSGHVVSGIVRRAALLTIIGIALGSGVAWVLTRVLAALFVGVSAHDPVIFLGAAGVFATASLIAAIVPAVRTTRVNPIVALTSS